MAVSDVLGEMKSISSVLRTASQFPGLSALSLEADALDNLIANPETVQKIYDAVESGVHLLEALKDHGLAEAYHFLTTWAPRAA